MSERVERTARWMYRGIWRVLVDLFRVPDRPPTLPPVGDEPVDSFQPAGGFLKYLQFWFWIVLFLTDIAILVAWVAILAAVPWLGAVLALPALGLAVIPDIIAWIAIHLRFDTTWYVMSDRSLRIRRGIWVIHETTITFENVQNVKIHQGPLQRYFGISSIVVETAGAGEAGPHGTHFANQGIIEGIAHAADLRDRILARMRRSRTAGLGDEEEPAALGWTPAHVEVLREIRNEVVALRG